MTDPILSPIQLGDLKKNGTKVEVSRETINRVFKETGAKAVIIICLDTPIVATQPPVIKQFHLSTVNADIHLLPHVFYILARALMGKIPGNTTITKDDKLL